MFKSTPEDHDSPSAVKVVATHLAPSSTDRAVRQRGGARRSGAEASA
jgi:hypothetical protein